MTSAVRKFILWPRELAEITSWRFFVSRSLFTLGLNTFIAGLITLLEAEWSAFPSNWIFGQCIGYSILTLISFIYIPASRSLQLHYLTQIGIFIVLVPVGIFCGAFLGIVVTRQSIPGIGPGNPDVGPFRWLNWVVPVVFSVVATIIAYLYSIGKSLIAERERQAERARRAALEAQLKELQAQIEPHFLFNTLATLDALIVADREGARTMLQNLIKYLRAALSHSRSQNATLGNEIELLKAYLSIMELRLPNRLRTRFDCSPECQQLVFPPMLLQPLVENAITHGIEPAAAGGTITIAAHCTNNALHIDVEDSGVGLGNSPTAGTGAGTDNVRQRLFSLFGPRANLEIAPLTPHGTRSRIYVPLESLRNASA
jgi:histidine kinase/histidine kinase/DNA gyrase B/HSP90-like ATPase